MKALVEKRSNKETPSLRIGDIFIRLLIVSWRRVLRPLNERAWETLEKFCVDYRKTRDKN